MGTVRAAAAHLRSVHLDVLDVQVVRVQVLELGVALGVLQEAEEDLARLHRPAALGHLELLGLRRAADAARVLAEGHAALLLADVL
eukprot:8330971-Heterocapsa_arctica.AAC.1